MSLDETVEMATLFLRQRANLHRVTNLQEMCRVLGEQLALNGRRESAEPMDRRQVARAVDHIAQNTEDGLALTSLCQHFWDTDPYTAWVQRATHMGHEFTDSAQVREFHRAQMEEAYAAHENYSTVPDTPESLTQAPADPFS